MESAANNSMNPIDPKSFKESSVPANEHELKWEGHIADDTGATDGPDPLALLIATKEELFLRSTRGNYRLPRAAITKLGRGRLYPWFFSAVRIHHAIPGLPKDLQFKPLHLSPRGVLAQLRALGYPSA